MTDVEKPLLGKRILLTREDNSKLRAELEVLGAEVLEIPLIRAVFPEPTQDLEDALKGIGSYDWLMFSSRNGVKGFFDAFFKEYEDIRALGILNIACVGESTALSLREYYLKADCVPEISNAMAMVEAMSERQSLENLKILNICGNRSNAEVEKILSETHRAIVDSIAVYRTDLTEVSKNDATVSDFRKFGADFAVFASGSAVESFVKNARVLFDERENVKHPRLISIGESTAEAMKKYSLKADKVAENPTVQSLVAAILSK